MEIKTKHEVGDKVFYLHNNKLENGKIVRVAQVQVKLDVSVSWEMDTTEAQPGYLFSPSATLPLYKYDSELFKSKQELLDSL